MPLSQAPQRATPRLPHIAPTLCRARLPGWKRLTAAALKAAQSPEPRSYTTKVPTFARESLVLRQPPFRLSVVDTGLAVSLNCGPVLGKVFGKPERGARSRDGLFTQTDEQTPPPVSSLANPYAELYDAVLYPPAEDLVRDALHLPAELWPYQRVGVRFLYERKNALLADDMGLGKTVQALVALEGLFCAERARRALVICPKAVLQNWAAEAAKWVQRSALPMTMGSLARKNHWKYRPGLLLATPQTVARDEKALAECHFDVVIADDVTLLKNQSATASAIRSISRDVTWCLNGSPLENKPEDLLNVMEFVRPELFTSAERRFPPGRVVVQNRMEPYFLRRLKRDCLPDLPPKRQMPPLTVELTGAQRKAYLAAEQQDWQDLLADSKLTKLHIFAKIQRLIQLCNLDSASQTSAKADVLEHALDMMLEIPDAKVLVFSQWLETLAYLEQRLHRFGPQVYSGKLTDVQRTTTLQSFQQEGGCRLLLLSKAGYRGLNLQQACYVFHFDQTWNPHDALQAKDRAWRPNGHPRGVDVYRFLMEDTIEERIEQVLERKRQLFHQYIETMGSPPADDFDSTITMDELLAIMKPRGLK